MLIFIDTEELEIYVLNHPNIDRFTDSFSNFTHTVKHTSMISTYFGYANLVNIQNNSRQSYINHDKFEATQFGK